MSIYVKSTSNSSNLIAHSSFNCLDIKLGTNSTISNVSGSSSHPILNATSVEVIGHLFSSSSVNLTTSTVTIPEDGMYFISLESIKWTVQLNKNEMLWTVIYTVDEKGNPRSRVGTSIDYVYIPSNTSIYTSVFCMPKLHRGDKIQPRVSKGGIQNSGTVSCNFSEAYLKVAYIV